MTAREIATSVRAGERRAREVVEDALALVESGDGALHAFNNVLIEEALAAADEVDRRVVAGDDPGPLAGVPVALKDNLCTRGVATTCSSRILDGWRPPYDATVVTRLRREVLRSTSCRNEAWGAVNARPLSPRGGTRAVST